MPTPLPPAATPPPPTTPALPPTATPPLRSLAIRKQVADATISRLSALDMPQRRLAAMLGITQARLNALLTGKLEQFSVDALIALATKAGLNVRVTVTRPYRRS